MIVLAFKPFQVNARRASLACEYANTSRFLVKSLAKRYSLCLHKRIRKRFFGTPRPKKADKPLSFNVDYSRMPRQSSPKMSTPPASGKPPHLLAYG